MTIAPPPTRREIRPQAGGQEQFHASSADIVVYGGSAFGGKTFALELEPVRHHKVAGFRAIIFRRTRPELVKPGGLWDQSKELYPPLGAEPYVSNLLWAFPSGASIEFGACQRPGDVEAWKSAQITYLGFDQVELFLGDMVFYLLSRNRSTCGVRPYCRMTCNPDPDCWLAEYDEQAQQFHGFIGWWLDPVSGYPIEERAGRLRWMLRRGDETDTILWADSREEAITLGREHGIAERDLLPKSVTFIPGRLEENLIGIEKDPDYRATLLALSYVDQQRLLGGNWKIRPTRGNVFNRTWFEIVDAVPADCQRVRYGDKAATKDKGERENPRGARSASVRIARSAAGIFYVEHAIAGRYSAGEREQLWKQLAATDPEGTVQWIEQEPGSGGKESAEHTIKNLAGFPVYADRVTGDKLTRAQPLAAQALAGNVKLVRGAWNAEFLDELHAFPKGARKDLVDGASGAFNKLAEHGGLLVV